MPLRLFRLSPPPPPSLRFAGVLFRHGCCAVYTYCTHTRMPMCVCVRAYMDSTCERACHLVLVVCTSLCVCVRCSLRAHPPFSHLAMKSNYVALAPAACVRSCVPGCVRCFFFMSLITSTSSHAILRLSCSPESKRFVVACSRSSSVSCSSTSAPAGVRPWVQEAVVCSAFGFPYLLRGPSIAAAAPCCCRVQGDLCRHTEWRR